MVSISSRRSALMRPLSRWRATRNWVSVTRRIGSFYRAAHLAPREPRPAEERRGEQPEDRRHAHRDGKRARAERDEGLAGVDHGGADADRLALAAFRRRLVEKRHDDRLRAAQAEAE